MTDELEDAYKFKLQDIRGRVRGLHRDVKRLLETATDAARADEPFIPCVLERLERSTEIINKFDSEIES